MGITHLVYSNLVGGNIVPIVIMMTTIAALCHGITRRDLRDCALIKQRVTGQIGGNAALTATGSVASPFTFGLRGWETNAFPDAGIVA